jgi:hypothetical protein
VRGTWARRTWRQALNVPDAAARRHRHPGRVRTRTSGTRPTRRHDRATNARRPITSSALWWARSVPYGARLPVGDRPRGAGADALPLRTPAAHRGGLRRGRLERDGDLHRLHRRRGSAACRRRGRGGGHRERAPQRHAERGGAGGAPRQPELSAAGRRRAGGPRPLDLGWSRLSRRRTGAQLPARYRTRDVRVAYTGRSCLQAVPAGASSRSRPRTPSPTAALAAGGRPGAVPQRAWRQGRCARGPCWDPCDERPGPRTSSPRRRSPS